MVTLVTSCYCPIAFKDDFITHKFLPLWLPSGVNDQRWAPLAVRLPFGLFVPGVSGFVTSRKGGYP